MFCRFVCELARRGGHVIVYCYPALARLFSRLPGVAEVVTCDGDVPEFDCWVAMGSLPLKLDAALKAETYLTVEHPESRTKGCRVGLCWQGNKAHARDSYRSMPFAALKPLLDIPGVEFVSLQQGDTESGLENIADYCHDLYDLGRAMRGLDLVITVDTAVAHLAGALGVRAYVLLGKPSDWRWNSELYESVTTFRNEAPKKWESLVATIKETVEHMAVVINRAETCFPRATYDEAHGRDAVATCETRHGRLSYFTRDVWLGRSLETYGEWSEGECELYRRVLGPDDTVVEVGSNIGAHTVELGKLAKTVYAFEPNKETYDVLKSNTKGQESVVCLLLAAGSANGTGSLHTKVNNPGGTEVQVGEGEISIVKIDDLFPEVPVSFIKLDCEGSELEALKGAADVLAARRPLLYVENDRVDKSDALVAWLHEHGYRMYQHYTRLFNPNNYRGQKLNVFGNLVSAMLFCVPNERRDLRPTEWGMDRVRVNGRPA